MGTRRQFSREFKIERVKLALERDMSIKQAREDLEIHQTMQRTWTLAMTTDPQVALPDKRATKAGNA